MENNSIAAFSANVGGIRLSQTQFIARTCNVKQSLKSANRRSRVVPCARVRKGFAPDPVIPDTLFDAAPIKDIDRNTFEFSSLEGQVVFLVNVASKDTHAEANFDMMADLYDKYHSSGLRILAYPSNWYGQKELGTYEEIKEFVQSKWGTRFDLMGKVDLELDSAFALGCKHFPGEIIWNFHGKFLFNRKGIPIARFDLLTTTDFIESAIERALMGDA